MLYAILGGAEAMGDIRRVVGPIVSTRNGKAVAFVFVDHGADDVELRLGLENEAGFRSTTVSRLSAARFLDDPSDPVLNTEIERLLSDPLNPHAH